MTLPIFFQIMIFAVLTGCGLDGSNESEISERRKTSTNPAKEGEGSAEPSPEPSVSGEYSGATSTPSPSPSSSTFPEIARKAGVGSWTSIDFQSLSWTNTNLQTVYATNIGSGIFLASSNGDAAKLAFASDTWSSVTTPTDFEKRVGARHTFTGSDVVIWGGLAKSSDGRDTYPKAGWKYNVTSGSFTRTAELNAPNGMVLFGQGLWTGLEVMYFGGGSPAVRFDFGLYNASANTWVKYDSPGFRLDACRSATVADKVYLMCAGDGEELVRIDKVYEPATNTWTNLSLAEDIPCGHLGALVEVGGKLQLWQHRWKATKCGFVGSSFDENRTIVGYEYNPVTASWSKLGQFEFSYQIYIQDAVLVDGRVAVLVSPALQQDALFLSGVLFTPSSKTFEEISSISSPIRPMFGLNSEEKRLQTVVDGKDVYVFDGGKEGIEPYSGRFTLPNP